MKKVRIYEMPSLYREPLEITGYRFGKGEKAMAVARESLDVLWDRNVVIAADGYPELERICKVAGLGGTPYRSGTYDYYIHETVCSGDTKGTAPFLMALACVGA